MNFQEKLEAIVKKNNSLLCVGLDQGEWEFNQKIIDQTHDLVCAYKPNFAFYEALGIKGWENLKKTVEYLQRYHPGVVTIADAKRADIGNTNQGYVKAIFDELGFDAVTVNPYFGKEALQPFLERKDKGIIILCKTSNPGSGEFQDLIWEKVAKNVVSEWNKNNNCLLVVGATYPEELGQIRKIVGEMTLLVPGIGAQGGEVAKVVKAGLNSNKSGMIINSSRGIIFSANPRLEAQKLRDEINKYR
ncbi:orotidine 5'-phosphate decarboxylase [Candidatus Beckwithbacteria bacterium CG2_30_44_31]|uniref:Orotidine-5'-phosphate decarboxylase n=1 Tax=Candidatus Beckwithbacteria bacterium CG2_30_44_31 TaxID=1805035 RepID=A0A1J5AYR5_9BACT|nr:MAG: orotidine 5'-phosphate decarboxylase [Candidatus Beckwithbacteria bacterium CG2_30_44_31]